MCSDERVSQPFVTGVNIYDPEEQRRRKERALRFGTTVIDPVAEIHGMSAEEYAQHYSEIADSAMDAASAAAAASEASDAMHSGENDFPAIFDPESLALMDSEEVEAETNAFDPQADHRWDTVHLFGSKMLAENMNTQHVLTLFKEYGATHVEWITDSRCNVVFSDVFGAKRALMLRSRARDRDVAAAMSYIVNNSVPVAFAQEDLACVVWRTALDHASHSSLAMRVATVLDVKNADRNRPRAPSAFYLRNRAYHARLIRERNAVSQHGTAESRAARFARTGAATVRQSVPAPRKDTAAVAADPAEVAAAMAALGADEAGRERKGRGFLASAAGVLSTVPTDVPGSLGGSQRVTVVRKAAEGSSLPTWGPVRGGGNGADRPEVRQDQSLRMTVDHRVRAGRQRENPLSVGLREQRLRNTTTSKLQERPRLNLLASLNGSGGAGGSGAARGVFVDVESAGSGLSAMFVRDQHKREAEAAEAAAEAEAAAAAAAAAQAAIAASAEQGGYEAAADEHAGVKHEGGAAMEGDN